MTFEIVFKDNSIKINGLKKINQYSLKKLFEKNNFTNFDNLYQEFNFVLSTNKSSDNFSWVNLTNQTIIIEEGVNYRLTLFGDDLNNILELQAFFSQHKILNFTEETNINKCNIFLENEDRYIDIYDMKILNMSSLQKLLNMFTLKINIENLIITIHINKKAQTISEIKFNEGQNWLINDELKYIIKIDTQDGFTSIAINDFFSENNNMYLHYNDNIVDNPPTLTIYDELEQFNVKVTGIKLINFEVIRKFMYDKLKILNVISVDFILSDETTRLDIYENTYLKDNHNYKLIMVVNKDAPSILHARIRDFMVNNNGKIIDFQAVNYETRKKIEIMPITNIVKPTAVVDIREPNVLTEELYKIYKLKPELFDIFNKLITKPNKCDIQFEEKEHIDENIVNILSEFINLIGYNIDRIILQEKVEKYNNHLNLALRDLFCQ